ncbi:hypothetical protein GCM10027421_32280 [Microbacterium shaanxiense]
MSISALGYWRSGERTPEGAKSLTAVADIESVLGLDLGSLSALLPPSKRLGSLAPMRTPEGIGPVAESIDEMGQLLSSEPIDNVRALSVQIVADIDAQGFVKRQRHRLRIQAVHTPMTEFVWVEMTYVPSPVTPVFTAQYGCRVAGTASRASADGFGCQFTLDRTVPVGQSTILEYQIDYPEGYPQEQECGFAASRRTHEIVLWARFTEGAPPAWIEETEIISGVEKRRMRELDGHAVHAERINFPSGILALRWGN